MPSMKSRELRLFPGVLYVLALAASVAAFMAAANEVLAQADVPDAPTDVEVYTYRSGQLEVRWSSSDTTSATSFKIQWKSGSEEFDSSRQISIDEATSTVPFQSTQSKKRYSDTITGLTNGTEYTVRVTAVNASGDSDPSDEATGTPQAPLAQPYEFIEKEVIEFFEDSHPWLRDTWDYITDQNVTVEFYALNGGGAVGISCRSVGSLRKCFVGDRYYDVWIGRYDRLIIYTIVHELAHVYTLVNGIAPTPGPLGIAHLYFYGLLTPTYRLLTRSELWQKGCVPSELYADALSIVTLGDELVESSFYWKRCTLITDTNSAQALAVVRSAAVGDMASWLSDTYEDADGDLDLDRLWAETKGIEREEDRAGIIYQLRNAFGGYCDDRKATNSAFGDGVTRIPWSDGGCVPEAPTDVSATAVGSGKLTVSWQEPLDDGGSLIEGYRIQWKSGSQEYSHSRGTVVTDLTDLQKTISGLANNVSQTLRVLAYNHNGDGAATETTVTTTATDATAPALLTARVDNTNSGLRLTYSEALAESSVPATSTFNLTVNSQSRSFDVGVSDNVVTLAPEVAVTPTDVVTVSYTAPTGSSASPLEDLAGNRAANFSAQIVRNDSTQVAFTSDPGPDKTYIWQDGSASRDVIEATVTFSEPVLVSRASTIEMLIGEHRRSAVYHSGTGTNSVAFHYPLTEGETDADGISIVQGQIEGSVRYASTKAVSPARVGLDPQAGHLIDAVRPVMVSVGMLANQSELTVTWSEALDEVSFPPHGSGFTVLDRVNRRRITVSSMAIQGKHSILTLSEVVSANDQIIVSFREASATPLKDTVGNYVTGFSAEPVPIVQPNSPPEFPTTEVGTRSVDENTSSGRNFGDPVAATDADSDRLTYSISGTDAALFDVVATSGQLRTNGALDHESRSVYSFSMSVTDGKDIYGNAETTVDDTIIVTVTVNDVDEPPEILGPAEADDYDENGTGDVATYFATDPEGVNSTFNWSLSGADSGDFNIDGSTGVLTFSSTPDYESPVDSNRNNEYLVTVVATEQGGMQGRLDVKVMVNDVNEAPTVTGTQSLTYPENGTHSLATYRATDPERDAISWSVGGTDSDDFDISETGVLTFANVPDFEIPADANQDNEYLVRVQAFDGDLIGALDVTVRVTNAAGAEEPTITTTSNPSPYRENGTGSVHTFRGTDPQGRPLSWSLTGADSNDFEINSSGVLTFHSPPDFESPADANRNNDYEITVIVTDEQELTDSVDVTVTVTDVNEAPEIRRLGSPPGSVPENLDASLVLARYSATDPEGTTVSNWRTVGTDGGDFVINEQGELRFKNVPDHESAADSNRDNTYFFTVQVSDGRLYGSFDETVTVTPVNEAPTITTVSSSATALRQDENRTSRLYTYRATDPERSTVSWSVGGTDGRLFTIDERGQFSFREDSPPDFERPGDSGGNNVYDVLVQATDDGANTESLPVTVTVRDVNEPPDVTGRQNLSFPENHATDQVLTTYSATDPEDPIAVIARWSTSGTDGGDFTIDENGQLRFKNVPNYESPADSGRDNVYNFSVRAFDGRLYGYLPVTVTVTDVNEPPTITTTSRTDFTARENGTAAIYTFRATDPERSEITWALSGADGNLFAIYEGNVTFKNFANFEEPEDSGGDNVYDVTVQARDDGSNTASLPIKVKVTDMNEPPDLTGRQVLSFTENQSTDLMLATYNAIDPEEPSAIITRWSTSGTDGGDFIIDENGQLRFKSVPNYESPADSGRNNVYNFSVRASDGRLYGYLPVTVTVTDVNEPPTITTVSSSAMGLSQDENRTSRLYTYRATDPEKRTLTWSVGSTDSRYFTIDEQGQFSFSETTPPNFERPGDSGGDNVYEVTVEVRDDISNTASLPVTVTVRDVNEPPDVSGQQGLSFTENQSTDLVLATYSAIDPEEPFAVITRWSTSGTDGGDFTIDENGQLRFKSVPNYESPADSGRDNVYNFSVRASDGRLYGYLPVTVTVTDVNEPPTITTVNSSAMSLKQDENRTSRLYTYRATDPEKRTLTWSVGGADRNYFSIDEQGQFSFREDSPPNFERPSDSGGDNVYDITIEVRDDISNTASLPVTVTVRDVNEAPEVSGQQALLFSENQSTDLVLATYSAIDPESPAALITRWSTSGTDGGDFIIDENGQLRFKSVPNYESPADSGRDNVYNFSVRASDGRLYGYLPITVTVTDVNEPPTITTVNSSAMELRQDENRTSRLYTYRATDPEKRTLKWSVGGTDSRYFTIDQQGQFSFREDSPPNFEQPSDSGGDNVYDITIEVRDDISNVDSLPVTVTVRDVNEPPDVAGTQILSFSENHATDSFLATYSAIDPEEPAALITRWSTSGTDGGDFTIDEYGQLRFKSVPNYESPADSGRDNVYSFSVRASDGRLYGYLPVTVTVTDVNEPPTITTVNSSATTLSQDENRTSRLYTYRATDPEKRTLTWSVGGVDRNYFTIDQQGQFSFREDSPPNFEQPGDSGSDSVYDVTVEVRDDIGGVDSLPVTVTVRDVNEPPDVSGQQTHLYSENQSTDLVLATYSAIDPEEPSTIITRWSTSGTDRGDFTIDESGQLRFKNVPNYESPADSGRDNVYNFSVRASDGRLYGYLPVTVTVTDVNEPPTITTVSSSATTLSQDENRTSRLYTYRATDPEKRTLTWSVGGADRSYFSIDEQGQFSFSEDSPPDFERPGDSGGDNVYDITIEVRDDISNTASLPITVTVRDVNEPPDVSGQQNLSFTENQSTDLVLAAYSAIDPENPSALITRWSTSGTDGGDFTIDESGQLRFKNVPNYESPADSGRSNVYNFSVRALDGRLYGYLPVTVTVTDVNEPPTITTVNSSATTLSQDENRTSRLYTYRAADPEKRTLTWSVGGVDKNYFSIDQQGQFSFSEDSPPNFERPGDSGGDNVYDVTVEVRDDIGGVDSLPVTVTVRDVNEPPDVSGQQNLSFTENQSTDLVLATYNAIDPENPAALITRWSTSGTDGGDFIIDENGQLRFKNVPNYESPADSGRNNVYNFSVRASDGRLYGYLPVTVTVTDVNEPPTITTVSSSATTFSQDENRTSRLYTYRATDPEKGTLTWSVGGVDRNYFSIDQQGQFSFREDSPPNFEQPSDSGRDNVYDVTIQVTDDISNTSTLPITVTVRDVNEPPDVAGTQTLSFTENQSTDLVLATYSAIDPEEPSAVITRWSTSGTDRGDFTIDENGQIRFKNVPNYESPADSGGDNVYTFSVRASDGRLYGYLPVTVIVTDVNEPPTITTVNSSATTFSQDENRTSRLYTYRATDPEKRTLTWSVGGADRNHFTIDEQGQFSFREDSPPNFEQPSDSGRDNVYEVTIQVTDDISNTSTLPVTVAVRDVNEPPDVSGQQALLFSENQTTDLVLATYSAIDPEEPSTIVTRWSTSGTDGGDFTIDENGQLRFKNVPNYESPADSGRNNVYNFSVRASDGRLYGYLPVTVTVNDVNEPPTITAVNSSATTLSQDENRTSRLYTYRATDPEKRTLTWSVGGADRNHFTIDQQGQFSFREDSPPNFEQPSDSGGDNVYEVTIQVTDDISNTASLPVTVTVRNVNEPPEISGRQGMSFAENHATDSVLETYTAVDPEDPAALITRWSLSGTDGGDFVINERGELTFGNVPDHERPADSGRDNVYNLFVRASDGRLNGQLEVTVTVQAVNEPPLVTGTDRFGYTENGAAPLHTYRATDPERSSIEWSLSGIDDDDFTISQTGVLSFSSPPDYESPTDSDTDNVYEVTVVARDDVSNPGTLDVTVTVINVTDIRGRAQVGQTLSVDVSDIELSDGMTDPSYTYQWLRDDGSTEAEIPGATDSEYALTEEDEGRSIRLRVTYVDDEGNERIVITAPTSTVAPVPNTPATGLPIISGTAQLGETLTADTSGMVDEDGLTNVVFTYQWQSDDSDIEGATSSTYTLVSADEGTAIRVRVSFTDDMGNSESLTSEPTAEVVGRSVWTATLEVGLSDGNLGYSQSTNVGALSPNGFTLGDSSHSVRLLATGRDGLLSFGLDSALVNAFTLHVGGMPFVSGEASPLVGGDGHTYRWSGSSLGWNVGDEVTLILNTDN